MNSVFISCLLKQSPILLESIGRKPWHYEMCITNPSCTVTCHLPALGRFRNRGPVPELHHILAFIKITHKTKDGRMEKTELLGVSATFSTQCLDLLIHLIRELHKPVYFGLFCMHLQWNKNWCNANIHGKGNILAFHTTSLFDWFVFPPSFKSVNRC